MKYPAYVVNADFEDYAVDWTTDNAAELTRLLERAEHYVDLMGSTFPIVRPSTDTLHKLETTGDPTGGTIQLTVAGVTTSLLVYNPSSTVVANALFGATGLSGNVTGGPLGAAPIYIGYAGGLYVAPGSVAASLTGGAGPQATFTLSGRGGALGKRFNLSRMQAHEIQAVKNAVCAQAEYMIQVPDATFIEDQFQTVKGPQFTTTGKVSRVAPKVKRELALAGLLAGMGRARY